MAWLRSLCPAPSIGGALGKKRTSLFERSEFRCAPSVSPTRRVKRDTGFFFWFVFFYVEENEQYISVMCVKICTNQMLHDIAWRNCFQLISYNSRQHRYCCDT